MNQKQKNLQPYKRIFKFIETLIILAGVCAPFVFIWYVQINTIQFIPFTGKGNIFECLVYAAAALIFIRLYRSEERPEGYVSQGVTAKKTTFVDRNGNTVTKQQGDVVRFDSNGLLIE